MTGVGEADGAGGEDGACGATGDGDASGADGEECSGCWCRWRCRWQGLVSVFQMVMLLPVMRWVMVSLTMLVVGVLQALSGVMAV